MNLPITDVDLFVTEECNLSCKYCFHPKGVDKLTSEMGKAIIDRLAVLCPEKITLNFWGGEPMLYKELIAELIEYAAQFWKPENFRTTIVTNGTIYDGGDAFKTFKKYHTSIQVSLDGDAETNDAVRGETATVAANIKNLLSNFPETTVRMTYLPSNVHRLVQNVLFIRDLGIKKIMHQACIEDDWTDEAVKTYYEQLEALYRITMKSPDLGVMFIDKNMRICDDMEMVGKEYCGAGRQLIAVLPNGDAYPCHRAASNKQFRLGSVFTKIIRGMFLNIDKGSTGCVNCRAWKLCHTCVMTHYKVNKKLEAPIKQYCKLMLVEHALAEKYLPINKQVQRDDVMRKMATVVADLAEDMSKVKTLLEEMKKETHVAQS